MFVLKEMYQWSHLLAMIIELIQVILLFGGIPFLWRISGDVTEYFGFGEEYEVMHKRKSTRIIIKLNDLYQCIDTIVLAPSLKIA